MKKRIKLITAIFIILNGFIMQSFAQPDLYTEGNTALLIEAKYGQIIYKEEENTRRLPASITKIMTVAKAFDIIKEKDIPLDTFVKVSKKAASTKGATIKILEGEMLTIDSLLSAIIINSANNASVILAEYFSGSEEEFVKLMNNKAQDMGLKNTNFVSCNGLTLSEDHYSTALDISKIALELIEEKEILRYCSTIQKDITIYKNPNTPIRRITLESTNKLLGKYEGIDGLKTGWMGSPSGYCFVGTAQENGTRLISVSLGAQQEGGNFRDTIKMLDYGFEDFSYFNLLNKEEKVGKVKVNGSFKKIKGVLEKDLVIYGNLEPEKYTTQAIFDDLELPVKAGQIVGKLNVYAEENIVYQVDITSMDDVKKSWIILLKEKISSNFL